MAKIVDADAPVKPKAKIVTIDDNNEKIRKTNSALDNPAIIPVLSPDQQPETIDKFRYYVGRHLASALPALGSVGGGLLGARGGKPMLGASLGAAGGSFLGQEARTLAPRAFGSPSDTPIQDAATDTVTQGLLPELLGSFVQAGIPGLAQSLLSTKIVGKIAKNIPAIKAARESERLAEQTSKMETFRQPPTQVNSDAEIQALRAANNGRTLPLAEQGIKFNTMSQNQRAAASFDDTQKLINKGYSPTSGKINAVKILDDLAKNPHEYTGIDTTTRENLKTFLTEVQTSKPLIAKSDHPLISYAKNRVIFALPAALTGMATGSTLAGGAAAGSLVLTDKVIAHLMKNPETSAIVLKAIKTPSTAPEAGFVSLLLKNALRGQEIILNTPDEKNQRAVVGEDGQLQYPKPQ